MYISLSNKANNENITIMKNFTAIYSTQTISNINYSFKAKSMAAAKRFAKDKFNVFKVKIVLD